MHPLLTEPAMLPPITLVIIQALTPLVAAAATGADLTGDDANDRRSAIATITAALTAFAHTYATDTPATSGNLIAALATALIVPTVTYLAVWKRLNINERILPSVNIGNNRETPMGAHGGN